MNLKNVIAIEIKENLDDKKKQLEKVEDWKETKKGKELLDEYKNINNFITTGNEEKEVIHLERLNTILNYLMNIITIKLNSKMLLNGWLLQMRLLLIIF